MTRLALKTTGTLLGAAVAAFVAWQQEGALGVGTLGGFLVGAGVTLWGIEHQKAVVRTQPARIWHAFALAFFAKFGGLLAATLALRFVPGVAERCDWRSFLVTYGLAALLVLLCGMPEVARALKPSASLETRTST